MAGLKEIFLTTRTEILNNLVLYQDYKGNDVKVLTCEMWNEQYIEQETGNERSFRYPAIFIDFPEEIEYESLGAGLVETDNLTIRFVFVMEYFKPRSTAIPENLDIFDARTAIIKKFAQFNPPTTAAKNAFTFITDRRNTNNNNLWVWEFDFKCWYREESGYVDQDLIEVIGVDIETQQTLKIDNDQIRTAKNFD